MRKITIIGLGISLILAFASCKSSESAYKKAYETAKKQDLTNSQETDDVIVGESVGVIPPSSPATPSVAGTTVVRRERVNVVSGNDGLKTYSIVCGSFSLKTNAEALKSFLQSERYSKATIVFNPATVMYRVIVDSYDDKESATNARDIFKAKYPYRSDFQESWILQKI
jgi:cell division protein FtsN